MAGLRILPPGIRSYRDAKRFLKDAEIISQDCGITAATTRYRKNGKIWVEFECFLESPEDDYWLTIE